MSSSKTFDPEITKKVFNIANRIRKDEDGENIARYCVIQGYCKENDQDSEKELIKTLRELSTRILDKHEQKLFEEVLVADERGQSSKQPSSYTHFNKDSVLGTGRRDHNRNVVPISNPTTRIKRANVHRFNGRIEEYIDANKITFLDGSSAILSSAPMEFYDDYAEAMEREGVTKVYSVHSKPTLQKKKYNQTFVNESVYDKEKKITFKHIPIGPVWRGYHHPLEYTENSAAFTAYKEVAESLISGEKIAIHCQGGKDRSAITLFAGIAEKLFCELQQNEEFQKLSLTGKKYTLALLLTKQMMSLRIQRSPETLRFYKTALRFIEDFADSKIRTVYADQIKHPCVVQA